MKTKSKFFLSLAILTVLGTAILFAANSTPFVGFQNGAYKVLLKPTDFLGYFGAKPVQQQANTVDAYTALTRFGFIATGGAPVSANNTPNTQTGTTYTLLATDNYLIINASGSCTLTLGTATAGRSVTVKTIAAQTVVSGASNVVPEATATAGTAILAGTAGKWARLVGDGTNWVIMESN